MIINVRGTSGSGKSTVVREVMDLYVSKMPFRIKDRKRPLGYWLNHPDRGVDMSVVGHYETRCGGCDTIMDIDSIYELVRRLHREGSNVLFEGLLLSAEVRRTMQLFTDGLPILVIGINTPLDECLASINQRRHDTLMERTKRIVAENAVKAELGHKALPLPEYRGDVNPRNTVSKHKATETTMRRLDEAGVPTLWCSRAEATETIRREFKI